MEELLTVKEVAEILRVTERTVMQYLRDGKLCGVPMGGPGTGRRWRITKDDLNIFIYGR